MISRAASLLAASGVVLALAGCSGNRDPQAVREVAAAQNAFALDLCRQLAGHEENLVFSPTSIATGLTIALAGARATTAAEIAHVLHCRGEAAAWVRATGQLRSQLRPPGATGPVTLQMADLVWIQQGFDVERSFARTCDRYFGVAIGRADFGAPLAAERMIDAAAARLAPESTPLLIDLASRGPTAMVTENVIRFEGKWAKPFAKGLTFRQPFQLANGEAVTVETMHGKHEVMVASRDSVAAIQLPYAGEAWLCEIYLPDSPRGVGALVDSLSLAWLDGWSDRWQSDTLTVSLPKFSLTTSLDAGAPLRALGVERAFRSGADFSGVTTAMPIWIGNVLHSATVSFDETGTVASTITVVRYETLGIERKEFRVDHPFLFMIRERASGAIVFLGRVDDPTAPPA